METLAKLFHLKKRRHSHLVNPKPATKTSWLVPVIFLVVFIGIFAIFSIPMGLTNMLNTLMNTSYQLLIDTTLFIMAIAVMMGAISALFSEFGVVDLLNRLLSPLMKPLYGLPGAAALGIVTTYLSDNPAILSLADDKGFRRFFKKYQLFALTNLGTSFGMGLIVSTFMLGLGGLKGESYGMAVVIGNIGALIGSIISTRLMLSRTKRIYGKDALAIDMPVAGAKSENEKEAEAKPEARNLGMRIMNALLEGGKSGVQVGISIIPGVLLICTIVMMLTNGAPDGGYTGGAYEGIAIIPKAADAIGFILKPLFGFSSGDAIAVPITALGSAGAAMGMVPSMIEAGKVTAHDISVFTAMCMCWSGYLSTHVSMMQALGHPELSGKAILSHTLGGLIAGISANWLFKLFELIA